MENDYKDHIDLDELLLRKALSPLDTVHLETLKRIVAYDVADFTEAEVRTCIIDPIIDILGYDKGTIFSFDLERKLEFLGKNRFPDYKFKLWNENFWLIEAKKPRMGMMEFEYDDLRQAIEYSIHPDVNASLVVLCDGVKVEIYDREVSVDTPMLRVQRQDLIREFDKIRLVLEPIQIWFFQKRRILRLLDKVFDKEFNMQRVEEFSREIRGRLQGKRNRITENFRNNVKPDSEENKQSVLRAPAEDLIELYMFFVLPIPITNAVNVRLVELSQHNSFHVMYRMFPDEPRDANDTYMSQAVTYLIALNEKKTTVTWIPGWLVRGQKSNVNLEIPIKFLLRQCLTYFEDYEPYRLILLAANAYRRITRFMAVTNEGMRSVAGALHNLARYTLPEISWNQIVASPENQLLGMIDSQTRNATLEYVQSNLDNNRNFLIASAKKKLKEIWQFEEKLVATVDNYGQLCKERPLGDTDRTEQSSVIYDRLGDLTLAHLHRFPNWTTYILKEHRPELENIAALGSWTAREMLGIKPHDVYRSLTDIELANRFFMGNVETFRKLKTGYSV